MSGHAIGRTESSEIGDPHFIKLYFFHYIVALADATLPNDIPRMICPKYNSWKRVKKRRGHMNVQRSGAHWGLGGRMLSIRVLQKRPMEGVLRPVP